MQNIQSTEKVEQILSQTQEILLGVLETSAIGTRTLINDVEELK